MKEWMEEKAIGKEQEFRIISPQCRKEEKYGGQP